MYNPPVTKTTTINQIQYFFFFSINTSDQAKKASAARNSDCDSDNITTPILLGHSHGIDFNGCETPIACINSINHIHLTWATAGTVLLRQQLYRQCTVFAQQ